MFDNYIMFFILLIVYDDDYKNTQDIFYEYFCETYDDAYNLACEKICNKIICIELPKTGKN